MSKIIHLEDAIYFPYEEAPQRDQWQYTTDLYLRVAGIPDYLEFHIGDAAVRLINQQLNNPALPTITFACDAGSSHTINKASLRDLVLHDPRADDYPAGLLSDDGDLHTRSLPITQTRLQRRHVLWLLASTEMDENPAAFADFARIHALDSRLNLRIKQAITRTIEIHGENYNRYVADEDGSGYRTRFFSAWGVRAWFADGSNLLLPGFPGCEAMGVGFQGLAPVNSQVFLRFGREQETRFLNTSDITMLECPSMFVGLDNLYRQRGITAEPAANMEHTDMLRSMAQAFQLQNN